MTTIQKSNLIWAIISQLKFEAANRKRAFSEGDVFFSLVFKEDHELNRIAALMKI